MKIDKKFKEIFAVIAVIVGLITLQWRLWITNELIVTHDSIIWYGIFQYFVDSLHRGLFPFWNPYMNCGETFFLVINNLHLLDPSTLLLIVTGKFLKISLLRLYHYDLLLRYIIFICGSYLFFRYVAKYRISALITFITLSFSSLGFSYLRQHAFILAFYLFPWILLFILKFLEQRNPKYLLWIAFFLGIALSSYHAMFIITSIVILLVCIFLFKGLPKPKFRLFFKDYKIAIGALAIFLLLAINLLPSYLKFRHDIVPTLRIFEAPAAAHSFPADFFNLLTPHWFILHFFNWNYMSESFLYIGLIPLLFAIIGLWFSHHKYKLGFLVTTVILGLLMLGPNYFIYPLFCKLVPFFSIIRNTHTFGPFFVFCLAYFTCLGTDVIFEEAYTSKLRYRKMPIIFFIILICVLTLLINYNLFSTYPSVIRKYHILHGDPLLFYKGLEALFDNALYLSNLNVISFIIGGITIFFLLSKSKINMRIKYFTIISFIAVDLLLFGHTIYPFMTMQKGNVTIPTSNKLVYNDFRIPVIQPEYPFYAFAPAMLKTFIAYSTKIPWFTTHIYEMKDFYEFINNQQISGDVKNVLMGVSAPKLRLIHNGVVLPRNAIIEKLDKMSAKTAEKVIFIEEDLPSEYSHLQRPFDNINNGDLEHGEIEVKSFNPNEIVMDVYTDEDSFLYYSDGFDKA